MIPTAPPDSNPYESPSDHDELFIVYWLKKRWWFFKRVALVIGQLSIIAGICICFQSLELVIDNQSARVVLKQVILGLGILAGGLLVSYMIYFPSRRRLQELEKKLPSAVQVEDDESIDSQDELDNEVYREE